MRKEPEEGPARAGTPALVELALPDGRLIAQAPLVDALRGAGLDSPWDLVAARPEGPGTGRGPRGVVELDGGVKLLVKQCLRGGVLRHVNPDRYFRIERFRRELRLSVRAARAGLPVAETVCAVLLAATPGWRAFTASRLVDGSRDLAEWLRRLTDAGEGRALYGAALAAAQELHDGGLHHRDLNLGNFVARREGAGWRVVVVDLDRARWYEGPVPPRIRRRALARLERSWRKLFGEEGPLTAAERQRLARASRAT